MNRIIALYKIAFIPLIWLLMINVEQLFDDILKTPFFRICFLNFNHVYVKQIVYTSIHVYN